MRLHAQSIATNYPGDAGIQNDPNVVLVEMFEEADINTVFARWSDVNNRPAMTLVADAPAGSPGTRSLNIDGPGGGGHLFKSLPAAITDVAYLRYYVKYLSGGGYHHSGGQIGGYNPATPWPQGTAGIRPNGSDNFTINTEPISNTNFGFYVYWPGMYPDGAGSYWGNLFNPAPALVRDAWMCVEVMVKLNNPVSATNGELAYWINGTQVMHFGPGFPNVSRNGGIWTIDPNGTPFPGFQWRTSGALNVNWVWLENYIQGNNPAGTLRYDHVVLARNYIGPIGGGTAPPPSPPPSPPPPPPPGPAPAPGTASGGGSGHVNHNLAHRCGCSSIPEAVHWIWIAALAALCTLASKRR